MKYYRQKRELGLKENRPRLVTVQPLEAIRRLRTWQSGLFGGAAVSQKAESLLSMLFMDTAWWYCLALVVAIQVTRQ